MPRIIVSIRGITVRVITYKKLLAARRKLEEIQRGIKAHPEIHEEVVLEP